jgi:RNA-binding motif X-linked protein 2
MQTTEVSPTPRNTPTPWRLKYSIDTAYIFIGGLPFDLSEGDILTIFSQFGEPTYINLVRDKESGKSRGFAFLKYEDQRSTDLAVDNLGGASIMGKLLKVDHTRYKRRDGEEEEDEEREKGLQGDVVASEGEESEKEQRPMLQEEIELQKLLRDHDEDDPMKEYLVQEKREEVARSLAKFEKGINGKDTAKKHKHHHRHHHRDDERRRHRESGSEDDRRRRHRNHNRTKLRSP